LVVALAALACGVAPGQQCTDDAACGPDLVCLHAPQDGGTGIGVCSFAFTAEGGRCLSNADCAAGLFCSNDLSVGTRERSGACLKAQAKDAECLRNLDCASPLKCKGAGATLGRCG
jgi:hypothetical protein